MRVRGFVVGVVALSGLELLSRRTDQASGALGWALALFRSAFDPNVPALHYHGHWRSVADQQKDQQGAHTTASLGPAQATVIAGLNAQPPASPA